MQSLDLKIPLQLCSYRGAKATIKQFQIPKKGKVGWLRQGRGLAINHHRETQQNVATRRGRRGILKESAEYFWWNPACCAWAHMSVVWPFGCSLGWMELALLSSFRHWHSHSMSVKRRSQWVYKDKLHGGPTQYRLFFVHTIDVCIAHVCPIRIWHAEIWQNWHSK